MTNLTSPATEAREALEELRVEFARQFVLYNPNAGISIDELIELTQKNTPNINE